MWGAAGGGGGSGRILSDAPCGRWCLVAVVQDDATAAAVELEPQCAAFVPLQALPAGGGRSVRAVPVSAGLRECGVRPAGRVPAVVFHPVRDRVAGACGLVAGPAEPLP